jgi:hypothetical protein
LEFIYEGSSGRAENKWISVKIWLKRPVEAAISHTTAPSSGQEVLGKPCRHASPPEPTALQGCSCVLRQAQDEEQLAWHRQLPMP